MPGASKEESEERSASGEEGERCPTAATAGSSSLSNAYKCTCALPSCLQGIHPSPLFLPHLSRQHMHKTVRLVSRLYTIVRDSIFKLISVEIQKVLQVSEGLLVRMSHSLLSQISVFAIVWRGGDGAGGFISGAV